MPTVRVATLQTTFGLAGSEARKNAFAVGPIDKTIDVLGRDSGLDEPLLKMLGMCPIDAIDQRRSVLAALGPCVDHVADQGGLVAGLAQLALVVVTGYGVHGRKVRRTRRVDNKGRQETFVDEVWLSPR